MTLFKIIAFFFLFSNGGAYAQVGYSCRSTRNVRGICTIESDCPLVREQGLQGISPKRCGYSQYGELIVCCEETETDLEPNDNSFLNPDSKPVDALVYPEDEIPETPDRFQTLSEQKCEEYSKNVTNHIQALPLVTDPETIDVSVSKCDLNSVALIVGGKPAKPGEFPFMAAIGFYNNRVVEWRCGGTLISDNFVLTAAHCTFSRGSDDKPRVVRLGEVDLRKQGEDSEYRDYNIVEIKVHPEYKYPLKYNDIALLRLEKDVQFSQFIRPACLSTDKWREEPKEAIATGWGKTDFAAAKINNELLKVYLTLYKKEECDRIYQTEKKGLPRGINENMICAGELKGGKDTCQGDSGGPLLVTNKANHCKFYIIGVTSFGKGCAEVNTLGVYMRVSRYVSWIEKTIW